ncbi:MAG: flavin reductase family protein [Myxococcota bacterium]|nr:flavin reductase family protein [Myxococcota bacterium]
MKKSIGAKSLIFPTPTWVLCTYDESGKPNAMTAAWAGICCSKPPCVSVSLRQATYSYAAVQARKAFTLCVPSESQVVEADYFGLVSGRNVDKFAATSLTASPALSVDAPYIEEFPLVLECRLKEQLDLGLHTLFVGEILDVRADVDVLGENGLPEIDKVKPIVYAAQMSSYHGIGACLGPAFELGKERL